jgi:hypothetical protein
MTYLPDSVHPGESDTVLAVTTAVTHVAVALDELKDQLEIANRRVGEVAAAQITEAELGRLFVRAAQFADSAIAEAEDEARQLIAAAKRDAERILADARVEAEALIEEGHRSSELGAAAAEQVQATIEGFTRVNQELMKDLEILREAIQPELAAGMVPTPPALDMGQSAPPASAPLRPDPPPPWAAPEPPASPSPRE